MRDFTRLYINDPSLREPRIAERNWELEEKHIPDRKTEAEERIKFKYRKFFEIYHIQFGHYFRHLFQILNFLKNSEQTEIDNMPEKEEEIKRKYKFYADITQAQLSSAELFLLFYNGICFPKMKALMIKYNFLENLPLEDLIDRDEHKTLYPGITFKERNNILD